MDKACEDIVTNLCHTEVQNDEASSESKNKTTISSSSSDCVPTRICDCPMQMSSQCIPPPDIQHELNTAKSILLSNSSITGDNLFDHLSELIRKITDQCPPNVVDYFEEFSRNLREQKFHNPDSYLEAANEEPRTLRDAENIIMSLKLNACDTPEIEDGKNVDEENYNCNIEDYYVLLRPIKQSENVLQIKLFWALCGCSFKSDEVYQLSCAMMKLIQSPLFETCRFWGKIYTLNNPYYIVEVEFAETEKERRHEQMRMEMEEQILNYQNELMETRYVTICGNSGDEMIPGLNWIKHECEGYEMMQPVAAPIPQPIVENHFDVPPEPVGSGLNRRGYYVVTSLTDEWIELPIVTPKQITCARGIKKLFTGDLEAGVNSYPIFPGKEIHYLTATIARITASTYIAPLGFYRKRTKKDDRIPGEGDEEEEEEGEEEEEEEAEDEDGLLSKKQIEKLLKERNAEIIVNKKYIQLPIEDMSSPAQWVHIRPSILDQGRVMYFDEAKALKQESGEQEEEEEEEDDEEDEEEGGRRKTGIPDEAIGPALFSVCEDDTTSDLLSVWSPRLTSKFNKMNRMAIMRSNIWPGSYSFTFENFCDTIYIGWGDKYVPRNYNPPHIPEIQNEYEVGPELKEIQDPTQQMEEDWRLAHLPPEILDNLPESCDEENLDDDDDDD